jgi:hypothetical protein
MVDRDSLVTQRFGRPLQRHSTRQPVYVCVSGVRVVSRVLTRVEGREGSREGEGGGGKVQST